MEQRDVSLGNYPNAITVAALVGKIRDLPMSGTPLGIACESDSEGSVASIERKGSTILLNLAIQGTMTKREITTALEALPPQARVLANLSTGLMAVTDCGMFPTGNSKSLAADVYLGLKVAGQDEKPVEGQGAFQKGFLTTRPD